MLKIKKRMLKYVKNIIHLVKNLGGYLTYHPPVKNLGDTSPPPRIYALEYLGNLIYRFGQNQNLACIPKTFDLLRL